MNLDWQSIVALRAAASCRRVSCVARLSNRKRKRASCGGCGSCSATGANGPNKLVTIELAQGSFQPLKTIWVYNWLCQSEQSSM